MELWSSSMLLEFLDFVPQGSLGKSLPAALSDEKTERSHACEHAPHHNAPDSIFQDNYISFLFPPVCFCNGSDPQSANI